MSLSAVDCSMGVDYYPTRPATNYRDVRPVVILRCRATSRLMVHPQRGPGARVQVIHLQRAGKNSGSTCSARSLPTDWFAQALALRRWKSTVSR